MHKHWDQRGQGLKAQRPREDLSFPKREPKDDVEDHYEDFSEACGRLGSAYGVERYLDNRRVVWSFLDGRCQDGVWYQEGEQICFLYEDRLDPQCWTFYQGQDGLIARFENNPEARELYEAQDLGEEMLCYGPEVGV